MTKKTINPSIPDNTSETGDKYKHWRAAARFFKLNPQEHLRVEWMIFFEKEAKRNAIKTCKHFGISRKTFYKWYNRFSKSKQDIKSLKNIHRSLYQANSRGVNIDQERKIVQLRKKYVHYGKEKLKVLYRKEYGEKISCSKILSIIKKHELYPNKEKQQKLSNKITVVREKTKRNFVKFEKEKGLWFHFQMGTLKIFSANTKRYIFTAVDYASKVGFVRMYKTKSLRGITDFLNRVNHFIQQPVDNIGTGNDSGGAHFFEPKINEIEKKKHFKWVKKPKDNQTSERFNKTFAGEWLYNENIDLDCSSFNRKLISWLIEYNFNRPHQSHNYLTPVEYIKKKSRKYHHKSKDELPDLVEKIVEYVTKLDIEELETLSIESIAMDFGISRTKLWRSFKKEKKMSPKEFLFRVRINQASILLRTKPHLTVREIAEKVGFYCYGYFFQIFKKHFGVTPGKFRKFKRSQYQDMID